MLEVQTTAPEVFTLNNRHMLYPGARFYVVPRRVAHRGIYLGWLEPADESAAVGAVAACERHDGSVFALAFGPGPTAAQSFPTTDDEHAVTLTDATASLTLPLPVEQYRGGTGPGRSDLVTHGASYHGGVMHDDPFGQLRGFANPGQGHYVGAFDDGGELHAIAQPTGFVVFVGAGPDGPLEGTTAAWSRDDGWQSSAVVAGSATVNATQSFDVSLNHYVADGTWVEPDGTTRSFHVVREGNASLVGDACHDDAECALGVGEGARCSEGLGMRCTMDCTPGSCGTGSVCAVLGIGERCVPSCDMGACPTHLTCVSANGSAACLPPCTSDAGCFAGMTCSDGACVEASAPDGGAGAPSDGGTGEGPAPDGGTTTPAGSDAGTVPVHPHIGGCSSIAGRPAEGLELTMGLAFGALLFVRRRRSKRVASIQKRGAGR